MRNIITRLNGVSAYVAFAMGFGCLSASAAEFYVSPSGRDDYPGTKEQPFLTLQRARDAVRKAGSGAKGATVWLFEGTHYLSEPLALSAADSGGKDTPLTFKCMEAGKAALSGARRLTLQWQPHKEGIYQAQLENLHPDVLLVNGRLQHQARYPNDDPDAAVFNGFSKDATAAERVARWQDPTGGYLFAMHDRRWGDMSFRITGKTDDNQLEMEGGWQNNRPSAPHAEQRFVANVFEELDAPGEWFFNPDTSTLYLFPEEGVDLGDANIEAAGLESLVEIRGSMEAPVADIQFEGIRFLHTARTFMKTREPLLRSDWCIYRGGAVFVEGAERIKILNCDFEQLGGNAVFFSNYNRHHEVAGCLIREAGASGIAFVGNPGAVRTPLFNYKQRATWDEIDKTPGPKTDNYPADCRVHDCLITRIGRVEKQTAPVQISMSARITVSHCSIYDVPRAGINISEGNWGGHLIDFCDVFDTVKETHDHGSFNSWGRDRYWGARGLDGNKLGIGELEDVPKLDARETTIIRNSRWRYDAHGKYGWDIDLDDGSSNYKIYNNLCLTRGIKLREGFFRVVENNIMVNDSFHPSVWYPNSRDIFRHNIVFTPYREIRVSKPWGDVNDSNLLHEPGRIEPRSAVELQEQSGRDVNSIVADALFVNPTAGDFRVKEGSPALALGFRNFPMDRFGVVSPRLKALAKQPQMPEILGGGMVDEEAPSRDGTRYRWLGADVKNLVGIGEVSATGMFDETGVLVVELPPRSVAAQLGLKHFDLILAIGGHAVVNVQDLGRLAQENAGERVKAKIFRGQDAMEKLIQLPQDASLVPITQ